MSRSTKPSQYYRLGSVIDHALARIAATVKRGEPIPGIPTGFGRNDQMPGVLHHGELTVVSGPLGMGASLAVNFAERWREMRHGALIFSPDVPRLQMVSGMLCAEARIDVSRTRSGALTSSDWTWLTQAASRFSHLDVWIEDTFAVAARQLRRRVRRLQAEYDRYDPGSGARRQRLALVVVDPLEVMRDPRDERARMLMQIAAEVELPFVAVSQSSPA